MGIIQRRPIAPAEKIKRRLAAIERENERSVRTDHMFGALLVVTIATAAMIGMAADSIKALLHGALQAADIVTMATVFAGVLGMNRALLASARNMRRADGRGEQIAPRDHAILWSVIAVESLSFGYMLWVFEHPANAFQIALLIGRAVAIPIATVYLEQQRRMPLDPVDIGIETEIGQGLGVMEDLVEQSYDRAVPTALKIHNYRANADLSPAMDARLERMTAAAEAYERYKADGRMELLNARGEPLQKVPAAPPEVDVRTPPGIGLVRRMRGKKPSRRPNTEIPQDERIERIVGMLRDGETVTVRMVKELFGVGQSTAHADLLVARERAGQQVA